MAMFKAILEFIGIGKAEPVLSVGTSPTPPPKLDDDPPGDVEETANDSCSNVDEEWADLQMLIQRREAEGLDLSGLDISDPTTFWARQALIAKGRDEGKTYLHSVIAAGFRSLEHWESVSNYYQAKWSHIVELPSGVREIRPRDEFAAAALGSRDRSKPRIDPALLEPIQGVSLEAWARASAALSRANTDAVLTSLGLERALFNHVDSAWRQRMELDRSRTIAARFSAAFKHDPR